MERLHALTRDADEEENVFWIDDENDDDFFVFSALSISNPDFPDDLEETKQTFLPSFLRLLLELFEVLLLVEEEEAMRDDDKANMRLL